MRADKQRVTFPVHAGRIGNAVLLRGTSRCQARQGLSSCGSTWWTSLREHGCLVLHISVTQIYRRFTDPHSQISLDGLL